MSIIRGPRPDEKFYTVRKDISEDQRLSWGARGLLIFLLGKPDHWKVSVKHLIAQTENCLGVSSGRDAVRGLLKELQAAGYVRANLAHGDAGRFEGMDYVVSEVCTPQTDLPGTDNPATGKPGTANPHLVKTDKKVKTDTKANNQLPKNAGEGATGAGAAKPTRRSQLPDSFTPDAQHTAYAAQHGLSLQHELEQFKDHHRAKGSLMVDWAATLRTWLRNAVKFNTGRAGVGQARKSAQAARQGAANGKLLGESGQPKDYLKGLDDDGFAKF